MKLLFPPAFLSETVRNASSPEEIFIVKLYSAPAEIVLGLAFNVNIHAAPTLLSGQAVQAIVGVPTAPADLHFGGTYYWAAGWWHFSDAPLVTGCQWAVLSNNGQSVSG